MGAIYRREMLAYFKNAIGYFMVGVYCLISGIMFVISVISTSQTNTVTYFGTWLYFANVILVSLLSFRFFSEEKKNRTDQLLLTSPVNVWSISLGKYLCAVTIYAGANLINFFYIIILSFFGEIFWTEFLMQMLGSLLIGCAMIAIGLFISAVTDNQIATVAATFGSLLFMYVIDYVSVMFPRFLQKILECINLYSQYYQFAIGILNPVSVVFYLSITAVFLFLTVRTVEQRRWA